MNGMKFRKKPFLDFSSSVASAATSGASGKSFGRLETDLVAGLLDLPGLGFFVVELEATAATDAVDSLPIVGSGTFKAAGRCDAKLEIFWGSGSLLSGVEATRKVSARSSNSAV
jgi:hypothetical protein